MNRRLLATLCFLTGIPAIVGGLLLVAAPDGSLLRMPLAHLEHSPFSSYLIPGLVLALVVGVLNTVAGISLVRRAPKADAVAFVAGVSLFVWVMTQMLLLRMTHWLQLTYLAVAIAIVVVSTREGPRLTLGLNPRA